MGCVYLDPLQMQIGADGVAGVVGRAKTKKGRFRSLASEKTSFAHVVHGKHSVARLKY